MKQIDINAFESAVHAAAKRLQDKGIDLALLMHKASLSALQKRREMEDKKAA